MRKRLSVLACTCFAKVLFIVVIALAGEYHFGANLYCQECQTLVRGRKALRSLHADHIVPYAHGGPTIWDNLQMICPECNWKKSSKLQLEVKSS